MLEPVWILEEIAAGESDRIWRIRMIVKWDSAKRYAELVAWVPPPNGHRRAASKQLTADLAQPAEAKRPQPGPEGLRAGRGAGWHEGAR